jgi:hypothetical protein
MNCNPRASGSAKESAAISGRYPENAGGRPGKGCNTRQNLPFTGSARIRQACGWARLHCAAGTGSLVMG